MSKKLMRKKLAMMLATLKKKRKFFCEVEYLESTGTQYIDTGFSPDANTRVDYKVQVTELQTGSEPFIGTRVGTTNNNRFLPIAWHTGDGQLRTSFGSKVVILNETASIGSVFIGSFLPSERTTTINGVQYSFSGASFTKSQSNNLYIFAASGYSPDLYNCKGRMYYMKVFDNGVLVRDLIPVLDWNMRPCMFDKVTEQLFYNQATSGNDFSYGREIHYVDYLESTGTQYINTGIYLTNNHTVEVDYQLTVASQSRKGLYGGLVANGPRHGALLSPSNSYLESGYGSTNVYYQLGFPDTNRHILKQEKNKLYFDGSLIYTFETATFTQDFSAPLGNFNYTNYNPASAKYYASKWWDGDKLVRDYIPAIDENGVGYMLDRVSHTIYDNAGTGAFSYPAREVEYLESDGARAIVAGVTVDDTCGYDVKWMALNANDTIILGTKGSGDSRWVLSGNNNPNVNISWNTSSGGIGLGLNKIQTAQMNYMNDRKRILNDTPLTDITQTLSANASTYNVGIFGGYWGYSSISLYSTCRIYYAKISKGTELIRDFIPMVKDGSPCLYDKVGGEYYFGTGTGSFTVGKIVEPEYE